jgi:hypothetical protein
MEKVLQYDEMVTIKGGSFLDGVCLAVGIGKLFAPVLAVTGVGLVILNVATVGCLIYEISTLD